jgi:hypothetical protein
VEALASDGLKTIQNPGVGRIVFGPMTVNPDMTQDRSWKKTLGSYRDCPGRTLVVCPKTLGRGSFDRVV